jgi:hypothetical protein
MRRCTLLAAVVLAISTNAWALLPANLTVSLGRPIQSVWITPVIPRAGEEILVTISGWKTNGSEIYQVTKRIMGSAIQLDVFWSLHGLTDWGFMQYEYVESLGTLEAGSYTLNINYSGMLFASTSQRFSVMKARSANPDSIFPWWWFEDLFQ